MGLYHQFQTAIAFANLASFFKYTHISLERSCKAPVQKILMRTILFTSNQRLKLYIILCILLVLLVFKIYTTTHSFPNECKPIPYNLLSLIICICVF